MKRFLIVLLFCVSQNLSAGWLAGTAKGDITPAEPVPLPGTPVRPGCRHMWNIRSGAAPAQGADKPSRGVLQRHGRMQDSPPPLLLIVFFQSFDAFD
jgi:hypothetical protein